MLGSLYLGKLPTVAVPDCASRFRVVVGTASNLSKAEEQVPPSKSVEYICAVPKIKVPFWYPYILDAMISSITKRGP